MVRSLVLLFVFGHSAFCFSDFDYMTQSGNQQLYYPRTLDELDAFYNGIDVYPLPVDETVGMERLLYTLTSGTENYDGYSSTLKTTRNCIPSLLLPLSLPAVNVPSFQRFASNPSFIPTTLISPPRTNTISVPFASLIPYLNSPSIVPLEYLSNIPNPSSTCRFIHFPSINSKSSVLGSESTMPCSDSGLSVSVPNFGTEDVTLGTVAASGSFTTSAHFGPDGNVYGSQTTSVPRILHTSGCGNNNYNPYNYPVHNTPVIPDIYSQTAINPCRLGSTYNIGNIDNYNTVPSLYQPMNSDNYNNVPIGSIGDYRNDETQYYSDNFINDGSISPVSNFYENYVPFSGTVQAKGKFTVAAHF